MAMACAICRAMLTAAKKPQVKIKFDAMANALRSNLWYGWTITRIVTKIMQTKSPITMRMTPNEFGIRQVNPVTSSRWSNEHDSQ